METLVRLYVEKFGREALPTTAGLPEEEAKRLLSRALEEGKPLTPERMSALGYPPIPDGVMV